MGRYREPQKRGSAYITPTGFKALDDEYRALWKKRRHVTKIITAAAAEGDRSENAEYIYRKKQLREIDRRVRYLQLRLDELKVVSQQPADPGRIYFGAWVKLLDEHGNEHTYRIVGSDEFDHVREYISMDAPVARALLGKTVDDEVEIHLPDSRAQYAVLAVWYD